MEKSGDEQLALNSKKIVLPEDAEPISENKQVATKEYVDDAVVASTTSLNIDSGLFAQD